MQALDAFVIVTHWLLYRPAAARCPIAALWGLVENQQEHDYAGCDPQAADALAANAYCKLSALGCAGRLMGLLPNDREVELYLKKDKSPNKAG